MMSEVRFGSMRRSLGLDWLVKGEVRVLLCLSEVLPFIFYSPIEACLETLTLVMFW